MRDGKWLLAVVVALLPGCLVRTAGGVEPVVVQGSPAPGGTVVAQGGGSGTDGSGGGGAAPADGGGIPGQWSLAQREYWNALNEELQGYVRSMNSTCGSQITAAYDYESWRAHMDDQQGRFGLDAYERQCGTVAVQAITDICEYGGAQQQAVRDRIRHVLSSQGQERYEYQGATFHLTGNTTEYSSCSQDRVMQWLRNHL